MRGIETTGFSSAHNESDIPGDIVDLTLRLSIPHGCIDTVSWFFFQMSAPFSSRNLFIQTSFAH
jgi:hypothetical protein